MKAKLGSLVLAVCLAGGAVACNDGGGDDNTTTLTLLAALALSDTPADFYPELGFPGTTTQITGEFSGAAASYSVAIQGVNAGGVSLPNATTLQFTMPALSGLTENTTVPIVVRKDGVEVLNKTIRFRPAPAIDLNTPNAFNRKLTSLDTSSFFTFTVTGAGNHLINVFGYSFANLDLYYLTSPAATPIALATSDLSDSEFQRINLPVGTYYLQVKRVSGFLDTYYRTHIANGPFTPSSTSNELDTFMRCYDFGGAGAPANPAGGCASVNGPPPGVMATGKCTYPSNAGIATRHYYLRISDGYGFDPFYAETTCTQPGFDSPNPDKAIWTP